MIPRYSLPEMAALFTDEAKFGAWLEVEILATEAWAELGVVPKDGRGRGARARRLRRRRDRRAGAGHRARRRRVRRRRAGARRPARGRVGALRAHVERRRRHRARAAADPGRRPADRARPRRSTAAITARAHEFRDTPMVGPHARHPRRADHVRGEARALGAAGAPRRRAAAPGPRRDRGRQALGRGRHVLERRPVRGAARVRARSASRRCRPPRCWRATGTPSCSTRARRPARRVEQCALEIRHLQRTEVREVEEAFRAGKQKGSSAMPHKRNPVKSEQLCGLARVLRADLMAGLENVALWHERDISHSSVERVILPDSCLLAYYVLVKMRSLVEGMQRLSRADDREPRRVVRPRVQPAGAARAGGGRSLPRRRLPDGAAQRDEDLGGAPPVPRRAARGPGGHRRARRRDARRVLRPQARDRQRRPHLRRARRIERRDA